MSKPIFFVYFSDNCGACKNFKSKLPGIREKLKDHVSEFVEVSQKTLNLADWNSDAPVVLKAHVTGFPSIFLLNAADYKRKSNDLRFQKFAGKDVVAWVEAHARDPELTATGAAPLKPTASAPVPVPTRKELPFSLNTSASQGLDSCSRAYKLKKSG